MTTKTNMTATKDEFNPLVFEKKLTQLKDTQDSIQSLSAWCLQQRQHHKKIVASWLNVLKRAKVDQRLTLFYLANDVIQYSKRKNYEFVESWGTTLQKATPLVRDEKVKQRILRIFKIWEERNVYDEEFLTDLTGLLSAATGKQPDSDPSEFQPMQLVNKIKQCSVLEAETDLQLKKIHDSSLSFKDVDLLCNSLKERHDAEEAAVEVEEGVVRLEGYVRALQKELVARATLCHLLHTAMQHYGIQRGEVKVVASAYRNFGSRVRNLKRRLDELCDTLPSSTQAGGEGEEGSPVPSPPQPGESVPSPEPDEDIDLPGGEEYNLDKTFSTSILGEEMGKGFSSFMGNADFSLFANSSDNNQTSGPGSKIEVINSHTSSASNEEFSINDFLKSLMHSKQNANTGDDSMSYGNILTPPPPPPSLPGLDLLTPPTPTATKPPPQGVPPPHIMLPPPPPLITNFYGSNNTEPVGVPPPEIYPDHHMPAQQQWTNNTWENSVETPESPPPVDTVSNMSVPPPVYTEPPPPPPTLDVDHRSLSHIAHQLPPQHNSVLDGDDVDHRVLPPPVVPHTPTTDRNRTHKVDVDHRNLISLTGTLPPPPAPPIIGSWSPRTDQDYRSLSGGELLVPPPPLPTQLKRPLLSPPSPPKMAKPIISSLPPNMPSHPPPQIPDITKLPPNLSHPPLIPMVSEIQRQLPPPNIRGPPPNFGTELSQVPLPPNFGSELSQVPPPPAMPIHLANMSMQPPPNMFSSHSKDNISHLPPSSVLKHPPEVLNQSHMMHPVMGQGVTRLPRTDIVESIDMEMSDDEMEDEYSHLGVESVAQSRPHNSISNTRKNFSHNRVLVGGDTSYYSPKQHTQLPPKDTRSNLVRINSLSEEEIRKEEKITPKTEEKPVLETKSLSNDFLLSGNLISDDDDFFDEIINNDDDREGKSPDIFDEVLLSSSNPENPGLNKKDTAATLEVPVNNVQQQTLQTDSNEDGGDLVDPPKWNERASGINPQGPVYHQRPFMLRGGPNKFRPTQSIFHRIRAPYANDYQEYRPRPPMRRPWGARPPRGYW